MRVALDALPDGLAGRPPVVRHIFAAAKFKLGRSGYQKGNVYKCHAGEVTDYQREVARKTLEVLLQDVQKTNITIGLGTGVLINALVAQVSDMKMNNTQLQFVPASNVTASEAALHGVPMVPFSEIDSIDVFVDEANEISISGNRIAYLVGSGVNGPQVGQPNIPRLQKALSISNDRIVLSSSRDVPRLGGRMAIVIESDDWEETAEDIDDLFLGDAEVARRSFDPGANPRGGQSPVVTGDMHMILDVAFYEGLKLMGKPVSYEEIVQEIENVPGIVAIGLVTGASRAILPDDDGQPYLLNVS
eukprot:jgi/Picsp_1/6783/NSC_04123-R1_protein